MIHRKTSRLVCRREVYTTRAYEYGTVQCAVCTVTVRYSRNTVIRDEDLDGDGLYSCGIEYGYTVRLGSTYPQLIKKKKKISSNIWKFRGIGCKVIYD